MRPSCGLRRSAMSSFASTFRRVVTPGAIRFGIRCTSWSTPSIAEARTTSASSCGSKWMSLAPSSAAWKMIELTSRTSGASETPSSTSRSSPSSVLLDEIDLLLVERRAGSERLGRAGEAARSRARCPRGRRRRARAGSASRAAARRSPWTFAGIGDARSAACRRRARTGSRPTRSSTWSGIARRASGDTPSSGEVDEAGAGSGSRASARGPRRWRRPRPGSPARSEPPCRARPRTAASRSAATRPVASIRSATSSATSLIGKPARRGRGRPREAPRPRPSGPEIRSLLGRLRSMESLERGIGRTAPKR